LSTWQLGVKHSITKRCTRGPCREVRLVAVANPHRVRRACEPLFVQVERGSGGGGGKECTVSGSWLKSVVRVRGNRSADRCVSTRASSASVSTRAASVTTTPTGSGLLGRTAGRAALRPAQQQTAHGGDGGETERRARGAGERAAVPKEYHWNQYAAEGRPADHVGHGVLGRSARVRRFGGGVRYGHACSLGPGHGVQRLFDRSVTVRSRRRRVPHRSGPCR
jgi:hypothetical protein